MTKERSMSELVAAWQAAKAAETEANRQRIAIETQMVAQIQPPESNEGTVSMVLDDVKIGVRFGVTRSVDTEKLQGIWDSLPTKAQEAFAWKASVSTPKLRALAEYRPADYAKIAACIEVRPSKPAVSVDVIEREVA